MDLLSLFTMHGSLIVGVACIIGAIVRLAVFLYYGGLNNARDKTGGNSSNR